MQGKFMYVVTEITGSTTDYYFAANAEGAIGKLGFKSGEVGLVAVVNDLGNVFHISANIDRDGFAGYSGSWVSENPSSVDPIAQPKTEVLIRKLLELERSQDGMTTYDPHAIVHRDYEADFRSGVTC